jgi:hypothetical protein
MAADERPQVIIRNCEAYDIPAIRAISATVYGR